MSARFRVISRLLFRQPFLIVGGSFFLLFVYVLAVGRRGWDDGQDYVEPPPPINLELSLTETAAFSLNNTPPPGPVSPPERDNDDTVPFAVDQKLRLERIKRVCEDPTRPVGFVNNLIRSSANLTYCVMPRSANTFWLQMLRYFQRDFPHEAPPSPFDLDTRQVRMRPYIKTRNLNWKILSDSDKSTLLHTKIFLSVQDPYWRLWTTYLNALTLPDMWQSVGMKIEAKRERPAEAMLKKQKPCGDTTTFTEFINYVLTSYETDFQPFYLQCDPCQLQPTYVIKSDTAKRDNYNVLSHLNLTWALELPDMEGELRARYIRSIIAESVEKMKDHRIEKCVTFGNLGRRLWHSFVLQGLLPDTLEMPAGMDDLHLDKLADHVIQQMQQLQDGPKIIDKRKYLVAAFGHIPKKMLHAVRQKYDMDFKLFGYDPEPKDIFFDKPTT